MKKIDSITYSVSEENRHKTVIAKTQIVLGTSLRKESNHILRLQHKDYGKTKKWNTYTISRTGKIYEHYDPKYHSDYIGIKEADKKIISIILENMGSLYKDPDDKYINWLNEACDKKNVVEKKWLGYDYWEKIPIKQFESAAWLCKKLCEEFNVSKEIMQFHYFHKDTLKFKGIVFKSNYIEDSSDINPLFDIDNFSKMLHNK